MVGWGVAPGPVVCERTAYVHDSRRGWVWVYWSWLDIHSRQSADCVSPAWRPYERHELQELQNAIAQTLQDNISSFASVPAVADTAFIDSMSSTKLVQPYPPGVHGATSPSENQQQQWSHVDLQRAGDGYQKWKDHDDDLQRMVEWIRSYDARQAARQATPVGAGNFYTHDATGAGGHKGSVRRRTGSPACSHRHYNARPVHTGVPLVTNDDSDPEEDPEEAMKAVSNEMEKVSKYRDARERGEIYPKVKRLDNIKLPANHEISQNRIFHQCVANDDSDDGQNPEEAIVAADDDSDDGQDPEEAIVAGEESLSLKDAESSTSWVKDQRLLAVTLCKVTSAMARMDLLNLGCSSRCMSVVFESEHKDQTTRNPFSTHSMLRPKHVAHIVSTLSACLLETVEPYKEHGHPLLPHLQLRTACRWMLQAMHRPMKARANSLLYRLEKLRRYQTDLLTKRRFQRLLAPSEKQAIEIVTTQHRTMRRILDYGILDTMWLPFNGRGVVLGMPHPCDLENQFQKRRREKEEWFWA